eukprot:g2815.t1
MSRAAFTVFKDGTAAPSSMSAKDFLLSQPRGAYTTARTFEQRSIFELDAHMQRLAHSVWRMMQKGSGTTAASGEDAADQTSDGALSESSLLPQLREPVLDAMRSAMTTHLQHNSDDELKVTVLVGWGGGGGKSEQATNSTSVTAGTVAFDISAHIAPLPPRPVPPVRVVILGAPRANADAKDSAWVEQRQDLERAKGDGVNEVLLMAEDGSLPEGTQTNFFAVKDGVLYTAGTGILEGTVRGLVLDICQRTDVPVVLEPPNAAEIASWDGAFISSTSRLVLPINEIKLPPQQLASNAEGLMRCFGADPAAPSAVGHDSAGAAPHQQCALIQRIEAALLQEVGSRSALVL